MSTLKYHDEINHTMQGELIRSVYYNGNQLIPFNIVIALAWLVLSTFFVSDLSAEVWFIFQALANTLRWLHCHYRLGQDLWQDKHRRLMNEYVAGCIITSMTYCVSLIIMLPLLSQQIYSLVIILCFIYIIGSSLAAIDDKRCFYILVMPPFFIIIISLMTRSTAELFSGLVLLGFSVAYVLFFYNRIHQRQRETLKLQIYNQCLTRDLQEANAKLLALSTEDELTGLANRRQFDCSMRQAKQLCWRAGSPISLLMLDLDLFKLYNDELGHLAGDECLRRIGKVLKKYCKRVDDCAARYGGEEFALILPHTGESGAVSIAGQIQADLAAEAIPHPNSYLGLNVTFSIGIYAFTPESDTGSEPIIRRADAALYQAKAYGRNSICVAHEYDSYSVVN